MAEKKQLVIWTVVLAKQAKKGVSNLTERAAKTLAALAYELQSLGPYRKAWPHFSKLKGTKNSYHCHLNKGRPTFVVCWRVEGNLIEVYYVGTHENAPY